MKNGTSGVLKAGAELAEKITRLSTNPKLLKRVFRNAHGSQPKNILGGVEFKKKDHGVVAHCPNIRVFNRHADGHGIETLDISDRDRAYGHDRQDAVNKLAIKIRKLLKDGCNLSARFAVAYSASGDPMHKIVVGHGGKRIAVRPLDQECIQASSLPFHIPTKEAA